MQDGGVSYRTYNVYIVLKYSAEICNDFRWDLKRTQVPPPKVHLRGVVGFFPTTKSGRKRRKKNRRRNRAFALGRNCPLGQRVADTTQLADKLDSSHLLLAAALTTTTYHYATNPLPGQYPSGRISGEKITGLENHMQKSPHP